MNLKNKITVGIPIYNESSTIIETLNSIQKQTFCDFEVIISDNFSTDKSLKLIKNFCKDDKRFKYIIPHSKLTSFDNFNLVFKHCSTKYFLWNSGHDQRSSDYMFKCFEEMEKNNEISLCYTKIKSDNSYLNINKYPEILNLSSEQILKFYKNFNYNHFIYGMIRADNLKKTNLLANYIGSDVSLTLQLSRLGLIKLVNGPYLNLKNLENTSWNNYYYKHLKKSSYNLIFDLHFINFPKIVTEILKYKIRNLSKIQFILIFFFKNLKTTYYYLIESFKRLFNEKK